jgi:hypothetical protein
LFASALNAVFGVGLSLLIPGPIGATSALMVRSVIGAASALLLLLLNAAIFRQLSN